MSCASTSVFTVSRVRKQFRLFRSGFREAPEEDALGAAPQAAWSDVLAGREQHGPPGPGPEGVVHHRHRAGHPGRQAGAPLRRQRR